VLQEDPQDWFTTPHSTILENKGKPINEKFLMDKKFEGAIWWRYKKRGG